jgi:hypothetical protein
MCSEVWHELAEISEDPVDVFYDISIFLEIFNHATGKAASKLHLGVSMHVVIHTKFAFSRLEQYGYCL